MLAVLGGFAEVERDLIRTRNQRRDRIRDRAQRCRRDDLDEMRRVLKPGGRLLFVEHGLSPEIRIARWQHRLTPYWKWICGGCHPDRKMDDLIRAAGFQVDAVETGYMKGPKPWTFMFQGWATKQE